MANPLRSERVWRRVQRAADSHLESLRRLVIRAFNKAKRVDAAALETAVATHDDREVERLLLAGLRQMDALLAERLPKIILDTLIAGAEAGVDKRGLLVLAKKAPDIEAVMVFDRTNPEAARFAAKLSSELVVEISEKTRRAIRLIISKAFNTGLPPRIIAKQIVQQIGLTQNMAAAIGMRRDRLLKQVADGRLSQAKMLAIVRRATEQLIRNRALNIARTETIRAANEGQRQLWLQAIKKGYLNADVEREWIVTLDDRLCDRCRDMDGQKAKVNVPFRGGVMGPPLHPQCRCAVGIVAASKAKVAPRTRAAA